jgi:2-phosphoglycolate phosphatase
MTQPLQVKAVIFDLDGTLADTIPLIVDSFNAACREPMGKTYTPEEVIARFGVPDIALVRRELQQFPPDVAEKALEIYFAHYEHAHAVVEAFPGITELLLALKAKGMPLGVMTGKGARTAEITVRKLGWQEIFGSVITGDDIEHQKPHPEGVLKAAAELGVMPQECAFVGDSPADLKAGRAAGAKSIAVVWHSFFADELRALTPEYWVETPAELAALLGVSSDF